MPNTPQPDPAILVRNASAKSRRGAAGAQAAASLLSALRGRVWSAELPDGAAASLLRATIRARRAEPPCNDDRVIAPLPAALRRPPAHVAVVGAGAAGVACAQRLAARGHRVTLFDACDSDLGRSAQHEAPGPGAVRIRSGMRLGRGLSLQGLRGSHDAIFLGVGTGGIPALCAEAEAVCNVHDAVDLLADLEQPPARRRIAIGRTVVVLGGDATEVRAAVQARLLGAHSVTLVCSRESDRTGLDRDGRLHAVSKGVRVVTGAFPTGIRGETRVEAVTFAPADGDAAGSFELPADQVFKRIGVRLGGTETALCLTDGQIAVTGAGRTNLDGIWAGGACAAGGAAGAAAQGRLAADDIHQWLETGGGLARRLDALTS